MSNDLFLSTHEDNLLAILMRDGDKIYDAMGVVTHDMFSSNIAGQIYLAMSELVKNDHAPTPVNIIGYLESKKRINLAGGKGHVEMLASKEVDVSGYGIFLNSVIDSYKARELHQLAVNLPVMIQNQPIDETIAKVQKKITGLDEQRPNGGVKSIEELLISAYDIIKAKKDNPGIVGATTGFPTLDFATNGYNEGTQWIYSGRPGSGKTTVMIQSFRLAANNDVPSLIFNREMGPMELMFRFIAMDEGIPYQEIVTGVDLSDSKVEKVGRSVRRLSKLPIYLDSNYYGDIRQVVSTIRKYHRTHGIRLVGIDYVQLLAERQHDQVAELGRISRELKLLALDLGITVVILSQLNRKVEDRDDRRPILSDLRQSGNLEEDADVVVGLYRDDMYNQNSPQTGTIEFLILKQRNGPTGTYAMKFNGKCLQVKDTQSEEEVFRFGKKDDNKQ